MKLRFSKFDGRQCQRLAAAAPAHVGAARRLQAPGTRAVTMLELLVAMSLLSFIILSLYQMFDRTQAQMRKAVRDVDKFESGRASSDLLQRDFSQMVAANSTNGSTAVNFFTTTNWSGGAFGMTNNGTNPVQQNVLHDVFFLSFDPAATPTNWMAIGYRVASSTNALTLATGGLGTLYRWTTNANRFTPTLQSSYSTSAGSNFQRVVDNVVHFRVTGITNGVALPVGGYLTNHALPAVVELELGYVDSKTADRARGIAATTNQLQSYLSTNVDSVHLFRLHVPIRTGQ